VLDRLLELLREGGTHRISDIAQELGTTPQLVEAMLEDLARMGYVKRVAAQCSGKCTTCPVSQTCTVGGGESNGRIWVLTEKQGAT